MCDPISIVGVAVSAAGAIAQHKAQNEASAANEAAAKEALKLNYAADNSRKAEEQSAATSQIAAGLKQANASKGTVLAEAAGANVSGMSVEALLNTIEGDQASFTDSVNANRDAKIRQLSRDQQNLIAGETAQVASVPRASTFATGLRIAGAVVEGVRAHNSLQTS